MNNLKNKFFFEIICLDTGVDQMCAHRPKNSFQKLTISMFTFIAMIVIQKLYLVLKLKIHLKYCCKCLNPKNAI